jgi:CheY-like chemotaxis protein/HPt (histidine-containing phosphotransfer) domain-containing protein
MKALVRPQTAAPASIPNAKPQATAAPVTSAKSTKILLAEDMEVNQFVVTETLARAGYSCDIANNGREAVDAVFKKRYDVVLMDCQMPEMSGFEAASAIRIYENKNGLTQSRVPIIALTANAVRGDRERCLEAGMDDYLTKPLNPTKLIEAIERLACAPADPSFDYNELLERCGGDTVMLKKLASKFQEKSRQTWDQLLAGLKSGDVAATTRIAHGLKGTAANLSATKVASLAAKLEELGRNDALQNAQAIVDQLGAELQRCQADFAKVGDHSLDPV